MKISIFFLFAYTALVQTQNVEEFLASYNESIDPNSKLDSVSAMKRVRHFKVLNKFTNEWHEYILECTNAIETHDCTVTKNILGTTFNEQPDIDYPVSNEKTIRYDLHFIFTDKIQNFTILDSNDSITNIEEVCNQKTKKIYSFNTASKQLLSINRVSQNNGEKYESEVKFLDYKSINGLRIATKMEISTSWFYSTIELVDIEFKYKDSDR